MASIDVTEIIKSSSSSLYQVNFEKLRENCEIFQPARKKTRFDDSGPSAPTPSASSARPEDILAALEAEQANFVALDDVQVKKLVNQLEKKMKLNREMRVKNPDDPKKFMDSEIELDTAIQVGIWKIRKKNYSKIKKKNYKFTETRNDFIFIKNWKKNDLKKFSNKKKIFIFISESENSF